MSNSSNEDINLEQLSRTLLRIIAKLPKNDTLWRGELLGSEKWYFVEMLPGDHRPLDELEVALYRVTGDRTLNLRYRRRYKTYTDVEFDRGYEVEEFGISGLYSKSDWWSVTERWSQFESKVDFRLDITDAMKTVAEEYVDAIKGLIALYVLTTGVEPMETIVTFGHPKSMVYERIKGIRDRLQRILKDYEPIHPCTWQKRLAADEVEPYLQVVEHY